MNKSSLWLRIASFGLYGRGLSLIRRLGEIVKHAFGKSLIADFAAQCFNENFFLALIWADRNCFANELTEMLKWI
ncbi:MAG: hypothetical protein ACTS4U_00785 [Candidatus Hodgkinia cicadicola]